jgi:hypothetical protein
MYELYFTNAVLLILTHRKYFIILILNIKISTTALATLEKLHFFVLT